MGNYYMYEKIGDPVNMIIPAEYGTDSAASNSVGVPIHGADGILFMLAPGDLTTDTLTVAIEYSSTGTSSDGGADTDVWAASDATFVALTSDGEAKVHMLDMKIGLKGMTDEAGKFFASIDNTGGSGG